VSKSTTCILNGQALDIRTALETVNESTPLISGVLNVASAFEHTRKAQPAKRLTSNISAQTLGARSVADGELALVHWLSPSAAAPPEYVPGKC
jgi:hypothetical protein